MNNDDELVVDIKKKVFKEASKQSSNIDSAYKTCALRCLADILEYSSSKFVDKDFESYWVLFIEKYFENDLEKLDTVCRSKEIETMEVEVNATAVQTDGQTEPAEDIKKLKLTEDKSVKKDDDDDEESELSNTLRLICLETLGKSWPHNTDMQGRKKNLFAYFNMLRNTNLFFF